MKKLLAATVAALLIMCILPAARAGTIIYDDNFDGDSSNLNGAPPDVDTNGGSNTWLAYSGIKKNGVLTTANVSRGAFLPFTPLANNVYTLSASLTNIGPDGTNTAWWALGFARNLPSNSEGGTNRFIEATAGAPTGRAWMLFRPNNPTTPDAPNVVHRGNNTSGTGPAGTAQNWTDATLARAEGGSIDMQIVLDTSPATWTATYYAKRPADGSYTQVSSGPLPLLAQDIAAIGFARTTDTAGSSPLLMSGNITRFTLSVDPVPEPAASVLLALGAITLGVTARRKK